MAVSDSSKTGFFMLTATAHPGLGQGTKMVFKTASARRMSSFPVSATLSSGYKRLAK